MVHIEVDSVEVIDGQDVIKGLYYLASLQTSWMATRATKDSDWEISLTTADDATPAEKRERELIEDVDPVQVKKCILNEVRHYVSLARQ